MRQHEQTDRTEVVRSEPVPVPPNDPDGRHGDPTGRTEVPEDADRTDADRTDADDRGGFHRPGPVPTAFGATTVGGAVAASALADPVPAAEPDPREERTARPGDGAVDPTGGRVGHSADPTALMHGHHRAQTVDEAEARDLDGTSRHAHEASPGTRPSAVDHRDGGAGRDDDAVGYGSPAPAMVDPDTAPETGRNGTAPDTLATAGTTASPPSALAGPATLFDVETAQGFRDRWRDVQLRFVDDPKAAAGQAQGLVEEAIQALAAALAAQKNRISGWQDAGSADTEQLRQAVRGYRDFLDRVLGR